MSSRFDQRPDLPSSDFHARVREAAFALLLTRHAPVEADDLIAITGVSAEGLAGMLDELAGAGWIDRDSVGRVTGSVGLSLETGPHRLALDGVPFRTWCAYDALGIAAALTADAQIETTCGQCGSSISLAFRGGDPDRTGPERLWLAEGGADLRGSFCAPTVLLCGDDHGAAWAASQDGRGRLLDLAEGARQGSLEWAGCATAARRVS